MSPERVSIWNEMEPRPPCEVSISKVPLSPVCTTEGRSPIGLQASGFAICVVNGLPATFCPLCITCTLYSPVCLGVNRAITVLASFPGSVFTVASWLRCMAVIFKSVSLPTPVIGNFTYSLICPNPLGAVTWNRDGSGTS